MTYKAITINGEPKLEPVNPFQKYDYFSFSPVVSEQWQEFKEANPPIPYIGSAIPDDTILDESEVEIRYQELNEDDEWEHCSVETYNHLYAKGIPTRRVATLKAKEPEKKIETCKYCECSEFTTHGYCSECGNKRDSEEGEQHMKEESKDWMYVYTSARIAKFSDWHEHLINHGYTLTKK